MKRLLCRINLKKLDLNSCIMYEGVRILGETQAFIELLFEGYVYLLNYLP